VSRKILPPVILLILTYGLWISPDFNTICAGVAIFLFGMLSLEEGFNAFTGGTLERLLKRVTSNRWNSLGFGLISTALMQTSSLVSVIAISFLSAGLITLAAGIGIIFGANLGTTTGAWLIAGFGLKVDIARYAMPMLVFGIVLIFQPGKKFKGAGYILFGLGLLFLGIHYMKEGFDVFKDSIELARFSVSGYRGVLLFLFLGIIATVIMQSSHATLVLILTALAAQQISYENALALAIGANVGTTITAILSSLSANEAGKRLAGAHLIFNMVTASLSVALIYRLVELVDYAALQLGIAANDYTLKLAIFHSIFNLLGIVIMLPFINYLVTGLERLIPEKTLKVDQPKYLSTESAEFPETAIEAVKNETRRVFDAAIDIILIGIGSVKTGDGTGFHLDDSFTGQPLGEGFSIDEMYAKRIKTIYSAIVAFISDTEFSRRDEQSANLQWLREANMQIVEAIKDTKHLQKNLQRYLVSSNTFIRKAYNQLREQIASTIQDIHEAQREKDGVMDMLSLDALKHFIDESRDTMTKETTQLIALRKISPQMGSSLLNDIAYTHDISLNLALSAQTLIGVAERELLQAARTVSLDNNERASAPAQTLSTRIGERYTNSGAKTGEHP